MSKCTIFYKNVHQNGLFISRLSIHIVKFSIFYILSEYHICSTGNISSDFGTRGGDSGTLVFLQKNGRFRNINLI